MKKLVSVLLAAAITAGASCAAVYADDDIRVLLDGQELAFDVPPQIIDDFTYVPMRVIFEMLGAQVSWQEETKTVTARKNGDDITEISMTIGQGSMQKKHYSSVDDTAPNEEVTALEAPPRIVGDRTLVPVRAIAESFGCYVGWNGDTRVVTISTLSAEDADDAAASYTLQKIETVDEQTGETILTDNLSEGKLFVQSLSEMLENAINPNAPAESGETGENAPDNSENTASDDVVTVERPETEEEIAEIAAEGDMTSEDKPSTETSVGLPYEQNPYAVAPVDGGTTDTAANLPDMTLPENKDFVIGDSGAASNADEEIMIVYDPSGEADVREAAMFQLAEVKRGAEGKYDITYTLQTYDDNTTNVTVTFNCLDGEGNIVDTFAQMFRTNAYSWTDHTGEATISDRTQTIVMSKR